MDLGGLNWSMLTIVGAAVLAVAIAWAALRNRSKAPPPGQSDDATRRLYEEEDAEHRGESDNVP